MTTHPQVGPYGPARAVWPAGLTHLEHTTMEKHTPGPWLYYEGPPGRILGPPRKRLGRLIVCANLHPCDEDDARLIAAAPDLLAALQGVLRVADRATDEFDAARAALAKAGAKP